MGTKVAQIPDGFVSTATPALGYEIHALEGGGTDMPQQIVMIHGALASRRYLMPTATLLAKSMRVFVPEMPGHGASSKPKHALSVERQADVLFEWFRLKALTQINIFANSYGCQVVAQLIADHHELASSLILTDPTIDPRARTFIQEAYRLYIDGFSEPKDSKSQLFQDLSDMGVGLVFETIQRMIDDDIRPKLAKIKCRTLVIRGEKDPIAPQRWTEEVARRIANARLCVIPNAPHCGNYATPSELANIMLEFIEEKMS